MRIWLVVAALLLTMGSALPAWADDAADCADPGDVLTKSDPARVLAACHRLADKGYASAQFNLAYMYRAGLGVSRDYAEAMRWYRKAADQGYSDAQFNIGVMYANGDGVSRDYTEAMRWFRKAADQGDPTMAFTSDLFRCFW